VEGDIKKPLKIGVLAGWDSDNQQQQRQTCSVLCSTGVEQAFGRKICNKFNIPAPTNQIFRTMAF
jgi:hypothetical protein